MRPRRRRKVPREDGGREKLKRAWKTADEGSIPFAFWMKTKGTVADVQLNLLCNGEKFDMPEHHADKVSALVYCPQLQDGEWHKVTIP